MHKKYSWIKSFLGVPWIALPHFIWFFFQWTLRKESELRRERESTWPSLKALSAGVFLALTLVKHDTIMRDVYILRHLAVRWSLYTTHVFLTITDVTSSVTALVWSHSQIKTLSQSAPPQPENWVIWNTLTHLSDIDCWWCISIYLLQSEAWLAISEKIQSHRNVCLMAYILCYLHSSLKFRSNCLEFYPQIKNLYEIVPAVIFESSLYIQWGK